MTLRERWLVVKRDKRAFARWAWLRLTGKTAYRYAPLYKTEVGGYCHVGGVPEIRQANGLILPARAKQESDPTLRADVEAAWNAVYGPKPKKRRK